MNQKILVIGGTGLLGSAVSQHLSEAGFQVRIMSRDAERARSAVGSSYEIVRGDSLNLEDLRAALQGCSGVHVSVAHPKEDECVIRAIEAAQEIGLQRITYVSGTTVCEENSWFPLVAGKLRAEEAIVQSGIPYTIFCPGWFFEMLPRFVRDGKAILFGRPTCAWHMVSVDDFGRMVRSAYQLPEAANQRFHIHGPRALTLEDALSAYCRTLEPPITSIRHVPYWLLHLIAYITGNKDLRDGLNLVSYLEEVGERGDPAAANAILGEPVIDLDRWLRNRQQ